METNYTHKEIDEILVKYLTGSADQGERDIALEWIEQSEDNKIYFDQLKDIYQSAKVTQKTTTHYNAELSWHRVKAKYYKNKYLQFFEQKQPSKVRYLREVFKYAAIVVVSIGLGTLLTNQLSSKMPIGTSISWNVVEAPKGSKTSIVLADGTQVWLNAGSKLRYPGVFQKNLRQVSLEGEAFFSVAKDKKRKFVVKTSHIDITALGTQFNVKAYADEEYIQTTLVEGSVVIKSSSDNKKEIEDVYLKPNQILTYLKDTKTNIKAILPGRFDRNSFSMLGENLVLIKKIDPVVFTSWKDKNWVFRGESLYGLSKKLERKYNIIVKFEGEEVKQYKFSGTLKDESLEQVLNILRLTAPIDYTVNAHEVILKLNNNNKRKFDKFLLTTDTI